MADVFLEPDELHVVLGGIERVGALHGDVIVPLRHVAGAFFSEDPFEPIRGIRSPGTGFPRVIALGTWRSRAHGRTFAAAYRNQPVLVIDLREERYSRLVVSTSAAERLARIIAPAGS